MCTCNVVYILCVRSIYRAVTPLEPLVHCDIQVRSQTGIKAALPRAIWKIELKIKFYYRVEPAWCAGTKNWTKI